ncbi:MAG: HAMP domain-containing histidine kinase [Phycicoccus sp.]|nr:HAMP domain-containing histidine kinase [Phycicoccus sp.]
MRRRISLLVAATTSAIILAFLIPMGVLVRTLAEDRAVAGASQEAQQVATLAAGVSDVGQLTDLVNLVDQKSERATSVLLPDGTLIGTAPPGSPQSAAEVVSRARAGYAFTLLGNETAQVVVPVVTSRGTLVVRTAISGGDLRQGVTTAWLTFAGLGLLLLVVAVFAADRLGRRVSAPVSELAAIANRLRAGELDARAVPRGPAETVELGTGLNRLADRIGELLTAEREAVADLSHRLRTPVTALRLDVDAVTEPELAERLRDHIGHLERTVDAIVKDARRPVRGTLGRSCDAASVVRDRVAFWSALAADQGRDLTVSIPFAETRAAIDAADLVDVVDALVDNVFAHTPDGTAFAVSLRSTEVATVRLEVADSGPGTPNPDVTMRGHSTAKSTGLGLDIVRRAAIAAGGELVLATSPSGGLLAVVTFAITES